MHAAFAGAAACPQCCLLSIIHCAAATHKRYTHRSHTHTYTQTYCDIDYVTVHKRLRHTTAALPMQLGLHTLCARQHGVSVHAAHRCPRRAPRAGQLRRAALGAVRLLGLLLRRARRAERHAAHRHGAGRLLRPGLLLDQDHGERCDGRRKGRCRRGHCCCCWRMQRQQPCKRQRCGLRPPPR